MEPILMVWKKTWKSGAAIGNSDLSLGTGIVMRMVLFIVMYIVGTLMVIRYAETVKKNKERSVIAGCTGIKDLRSGKEESGALPLNRRRVISLIIFGLMVLIIVLGYIPWSSIQLSDGKTMYDVVNYPAMWMMDHVPALGNFLGADKFTYLGDWYFDEFSIVFLIGSVLVALVNRMTLKDFVDNFIQGCCDLCSLTIIVAVSRGVSEIMGSSTEGMGITFVYWIQSALQDVPVLLTFWSDFFLLEQAPLPVLPCRYLALLQWLCLRVLRSVPRPDRCSLFLPLR